MATPTLRYRLVGTLCTLLAVLGFCLPVFGLDFEQMQQTLVGRFGAARLPLLHDWQQLLHSKHKSGETEKLRRVNDFFNQRITFDDDRSVWNEKDYWATPLETMGQGRGDCEDFSIAKYYSLIELGVAVEKLRLVYVRATQTGIDGPFVQAHMVLAYYATPNAEPLVLDNLNPQIQPASRRKDLAPVFSFNSVGVWSGTGNQSSKSSLSRWQDLLSRARAEGFQ